jgi:hypothetical protein
VLKRKTINNSNNNNNKKPPTKETQNKKEINKLNFERLNDYRIFFSNFITIPLPYLLASFVIALIQMYICIKVEVRKQKPERV